MYYAVLYYCCFGLHTITIINTIIIITTTVEHIIAKEVEEEKSGHFNFCSFRL